MKKQFISFLLVMVMSLSIFATVPLAASAETSGDTGSATYCTVKIDNSLIKKKGTQYAKVKIKTYDMLGWYNTGAKVQITLKDENDNFICSWVGKGGDTLKLGDDHSVYRVYVDYYDNPGNNFISKGNNFTNLGSSCKWEITNAKDCSIS